MGDLAIALAGYGRFGRVHARILDQLPGVTLAAICDVDGEVRARARRDFPDVPVFDTVQEMLEAVPLAALDVATDESSHGRDALAALERDLPVLVEKPLATTVAEAEAIQVAASAGALPVVAGHVSRFDHRYALVHQAMTTGRLGTVAMVCARRGFSRDWFAGFGTRVHPVFESMIHDIDLGLWFMDSPPRTVYAQAHATNGGPVPDVLAATVTVDDGRMLTLQSAWLVPNAWPHNLPAHDLDPLELDGTIDARLDVIGDRGSAHVALEDGPKVWTDDGAISSAGLWPSVHGRLGGALVAEIAHFADCVASGAQSSIAPLDEAVATIRIAEAIVRSADSGLPVQL